MKRIFVLSSGVYQVGGIQRFTAHLLDALCLGFPAHELVVLSMNDRPEDVQSHPSRVRWYALGKTSPYFFRKVAFFLQVLWLWRRARPELVVVGHVNFAGIARLGRMLFGGKYAVITHGIDVWDLKCGLNYGGLRAADLVTTVSMYTRARMIVNGVRADNIHLLVNAIDTARFTPGPRDGGLARELDIDGKKVLLTVSRIDHREMYKGHLAMLDTLVRLDEEHVWIIAGTGSGVGILRQKARGLGVTSRIRFVENFTEDRLVGLYNLCDVFVLPSKGEGFGIVFLEAMACGKPVVAGNRDGSREPLMNGELGFLVDTDDPGRIAEAIVAAFDRSDKRTDPAYLREAVQASFGISVFRQSVEQIFGMLLKEY